MFTHGALWLSLGIDWQHVQFSHWLQHCRYLDNLITFLNYKCLHTHLQILCGRSKCLNHYDSHPNYYVSQFLLLITCEVLVYCFSLQAVIFMHSSSYKWATFFVSLLKNTTVLDRVVGMDLKIPEYFARFIF